MPPNDDGASRFVIQRGAGAPFFMPPNDDGAPRFVIQRGVSAPFFYAAE